jgi:hypothetical protein
MLKIALIVASKHWGKMKRLLAAAAIILTTTSSYAADIKSSRFAAFRGEPDFTFAVYINGEIDEYDYARFLTAVRGIPPDKTVVILHSPGGNVQAGIAIGNYIHTNGFSTFVDSGGVCASICAAIWLAGTTRFIEAGCFLGFHSSGFGGERSDSGNHIMREYFHNIGLSNDAINVLLAYDPNTITWLTVEMSKLLGITYKVWNGHQSVVRMPGGETHRSFRHWLEPPPPSNAMPMRPDRENPQLGPYGKSAENGYMEGVRYRERVRPIRPEQYLSLGQKAYEYYPLYGAFADGKSDQLLEQLLRRSAAKLGDQYMIDLLNKQGLQGAAYYIGWLDAMTKPEATRPRN